jgi:hypothetical protein
VLEFQWVTQAKTLRHSCVIWRHLASPVSVTPKIKLKNESFSRHQLRHHLRDSRSFSPILFDRVNLAQRITQQGYDPLDGDRVTVVFGLTALWFSGFMVFWLNKEN